MDRDAIRNLLPHREPMLLVDSCELDGEICKGTYHVTGEEFFLQGHFPQKPVVPGVILCEIMAQSSFLLFEKHLDGKLTFLASIEKAKFRKSVVPNDTIVIESEILKIKPPYFKVKSVASVKGEVVCQGEFMFALV